METRLLSFSEFDPLYESEEFLLEGSKMAIVAKPKDLLVDPNTYKIPGGPKSVFDVFDLLGAGKIKEDVIKGQGLPKPKIYENPNFYDLFQAGMVITLKPKGSANFPYVVLIPKAGVKTKIEALKKEGLLNGGFSFLEHAAAADGKALVYTLSGAWVVQKEVAKMMLQAATIISGFSGSSNSSTISVEPNTIYAVAQIGKWITTKGISIWKTPKVKNDIDVVKNFVKLTATSVKDSGSIKLKKECITSLFWNHLKSGLELKLLIGVSALFPLYGVYRIFKWAKKPDPKNTGEIKSSIIEKIGIKGLSEIKSKYEIGKKEIVKRADQIKKDLDSYLSTIQEQKTPLDKGIIERTKEKWKGIKRSYENAKFWFGLAWKLAKFIAKDPEEEKVKNNRKTKKIKKK